MRPLHWYSGRTGELQYTLRDVIRCFIYDLKREGLARAIFWNSGWKYSHEGF